MSNQTAVVAYSPITEAHGTLGDQLVQRIMSLIQTGKPEVTKYRVENDEWPGPYEAIVLQIGKDKIELTLRKGK